jgi:hypothetical protein
MGQHQPGIGARESDALSRAYGNTNLMLHHQRELFWSAIDRLARKDQPHFALC